MDKRTRFWSRFTAVYLAGEGRDLAEGIDLSDGSLEPILEAGKNTHLLELLDVLRSRLPDQLSKLPDKFLTESRKNRTRTTYRNKLFKTLIREIDSEASKLDVPYTWLKGAVFLRNSSYPTGGRRLSDLDLLVRKEDIRAWNALFDRLGYDVHRDADWLLSDRFSSSVASTFYTRTFRGMEILIDLHWHLIDYPARRHSGYWDFSLKPVWNHRQDEAMAPEHRLLYLIDHAFTHNFTFWKFLIDLGTVLDEFGESLDWEFFRSECRRMNLNFLGPILGGFLREFFHHDPLPEVYDVLLANLPDTDLPPDWMERYVRASCDLSVEKSDYLLVCLRELPNLQSRLAFLRYILLPPIGAVPMVRSDSSWFETVKLYLGRLSRVLRRCGRMIFP